MKGQTRDTHIYFPEIVFKGIKQLAAINRRSVSAEIVIAVEGHLSANKPALIPATTKTKKTKA